MRNPASVFQRMSDSEEHSYHGTEMRNVTEGSTKKKGCCTRHPFICCFVLVFVLVVSGSVGAVVGALFKVIEAKVDKAIGEVCENLMQEYCVYILSMYR